MSRASPFVKLMPMKKTVRDIDVANKTVLVRVDYSVPVERGRVGDPLRIQASFETIRYLLDHGCRIVLMSHLGRPNGRRDSDLSLEPVAKKAAKLLDHSIKFVPECIGAEVDSAIADLKPREILLLENLRFHPEEEANDAHFAKQLAKHAEIYVDDAFATAHRQHASNAAVTKFLPAIAGLLMQREVTTITAALDQPQRPLVAIIGGAKVSDKIEILANLMKKVDALFLGGAMANTFLAARGLRVGKSLFEPDQIPTANRIMSEAIDRGVDLILPTDAVVAAKIEMGSKHHLASVADVGADEIIVDLGPDSLAQIQPPLKIAGTVIWNGPIGVTEIPAFAKGSLALARALAQTNAETVIGGGDTAALIDAAGLHDEFDWVSTGGGAALELMAGKKLPAYEALLDK